MLLFRRSTYYRLLKRIITMSVELDRVNASLAALTVKVDAVVAMGKPAATAAELTAVADKVDAETAKLAAVVA
jgi:hypothetical protein